MHPVERHCKTHLGQSSAGHTCRALTTLIWCSSPIACTQWWNREFMLSWICWTSSPSKHSNLDSRYSKLTWNRKENNKCKMGNFNESTRLNLGIKQMRLQYQVFFTYLHEKQLIPKARIVFSWIFLLKPSKHTDTVNFNFSLSEHLPFWYSPKKCHHTWAQLSPSKAS